MAGRPTDRPAKEDLETLFLIQNLTVNAIAAHYSTNRDRVKEWLRHYGISKFPQRRPKTAIKPTAEQQFVVKERRAPTPPRRIVDAPLPRITRLCELPYSSQLAVQRTVTDFRAWLALRREYV